MQQAAARVSSRTIVGLPLCTWYTQTYDALKYLMHANPGRDAKYLELSIRFTYDIVKDKMIINMFPFFMKKSVPSQSSGQLLTNPPRTDSWANLWDTRGVPLRKLNPLFSLSSTAGENPYNLRRICLRSQ